MMLRSLNLLRRVPGQYNAGRRAIQTASASRVPNFAFAFE